MNLTTMTRAFVLRIPAEIALSSGDFAGRIEEVDTGRECRFTSVEDFLAFLRDCGAANGSVETESTLVRGQNDV